MKIPRIRRVPVVAAATVAVLAVAAVPSYAYAHRAHGHRNETAPQPSPTRTFGPGGRPTGTPTPTSTATDPTPTGSDSATPTPTATTSTSSSSANAQVVAATEAFLATLTDEEKSAVLFDWSDTEQKTRWSNLPEGLFTRQGLMWGDLSEDSQAAWLEVMQATLSDEGYQRVRAQWRGDDELATDSSDSTATPTDGATDAPTDAPTDGPGAGGGMANTYGQAYYWVAVIGTPSLDTPWQWQWGGHHVTVNATISGSQLALYPSFIGAQPATYTGDDGSTVEPLGDIWDAGFALLDSLSDAQQAEAVTGDSGVDYLLYGPGEDDREPAYEGIAGSELDSAQQELLLDLISKYAGLANDEAAAARMQEIRDTLDETYFTWMGPTTDTGDSYFRVTGPRVIIEYGPQSMGGDSADHIHGIYRDPANDYGSAITE